MRNAGSRGIGAALTVALMALVPRWAEADPKPHYEAQLRDGKRELLLQAWFNQARTRAVLRIHGWTSKLYRAWKVELADLDGDGTDEVLLGIWSKAPRHAEPSPHRTVWVLKWQRGKLHEAWRGSALARPLRGFSVRHVQGKAVMVAEEKLAQKCFSTVYAWNGFGFNGVSKKLVPCRGGAR